MIASLPAPHTAASWKVPAPAGAGSIACTAACICRSFLFQRHQSLHRADRGHDVARSADDLRQIQLYHRVSRQQQGCPCGSSVCISADLRAAADCNTRCCHRPRCLRAAAVLAAIRLQHQQRRQHGLSCCRQTAGRQGRCTFSDLTAAAAAAAATGHTPLPRVHFVLGHTDSPTRQLSWVRRHVLVSHHHCWFVHVVKRAALVRTHGANVRFSSMHAAGGLLSS